MVPPPISVVIPLFNKEKTVARCLTSILKQTHPPSEIIIVNDGSTDQSLAAAKTVSDPRIRFLDKENGGVSAARNFGIARTQNEYVALLDADDEWHPDFLERMVSLIANFPDAGLYYAAHANQIPGGRIMHTTIPSLPAGHSGYVDIFQHSTDEGPWSSATVIRKRFLERTGLFNPSLIKGEDTDLWIRFALNGPIAFYNAPLSICHRDDMNSAMRKPCPPDRCLIANLDQFDAEARKNPRFYEYLQRMRVGHICNFLGGNPCELADAHREIDGLNLSLLPPIWRVIRYSPRSLRRLVFKSHMYATGIFRRLAKTSRR